MPERKLRFDEREQPIRQGVRYFARARNISVQPQTLAEQRVNGPVHLFRRGEVEHAEQVETIGNRNSGIQGGSVASALLFTLLSLYQQSTSFTTLIPVVRKRTTPVPLTAYLRTDSVEHKFHIMAVGVKIISCVARTRNPDTGTHAATGPVTPVPGLREDYCGRALSFGGRGIRADVA